MGEGILNTVERSFRVEGVDGLGPCPRPDLVGPLLTSLPDALLDAVRMGFLHSSRAKGRVSNALKAVADVRFTGMEGAGPDATLLHFRVPQFGSSAPDLFRQARFWDDGPQPEQTAFELLSAALSDVGARRENSDRFDLGLLKRIRRYDSVMKKGVERISLPDADLLDPGHPDGCVVRAAADLVAITPRARRARVTGRLDVMGASQGLLKLNLRPGVVVTALWEGAEPLEELRELFNREIVLEGTAVFRPSGGLLRLDADAVRPAGDADEFFRHLPVATARRDMEKHLRLRSGERSVYAQILQSIPGEESDEDFAAAVEALS